jgi:hypothetical protein
MEMSPTIGALALALSKAQGNLQNVFKSKEGYGYNYADLDDVLNAIRKPLADQELAISQILGNSSDGKGISILTMLMHSSGEYIHGFVEINLTAKKGMNNEQSLGTTVTYMRRYGLTSICGIAQSDDDASFGGAEDVGPQNIVNTATPHDIAAIKGLAAEADVAEAKLLVTAKVNAFEEMTSIQIAALTKKLNATIEKAAAKATEAAE